MPHISVIEPVSRAIETVKRILFTPFDITKWLGMGFTAWLALLSGGSSPSVNLGNIWQQHSKGHSLQAVWDWIHAHLFLVISLSVIIGSFILGLMLILSWISSRGKFMFLDNVLHNRADITEPWHRFHMQGNSYFLFSIGLWLSALVVLCVIGIIGFLVAMPDITRHHFGANAISAMILGVLLLLVYGLALSCVMMFLEDFIVPLMVLRQCRVLTAWSLFLDIFKAHTGVFLLYFLFKIVLGWAIGAITLLICCICCIVWIPYLGAVILLPLYVFLRSYSIHFLEQFGTNYRLFNQELSNYIIVGHEPSTNSA